MSIFSSHHTATIHPPSDPKASITIQKLSGQAVELAQAKHVEGAYDGFNGRGWSNQFTQKVLAGMATEGEVKAIAADPLAGYDRVTVVRCGIKAWSFTEDVGGKPQPIPINAKTVADVDDETLELLAVEIMRLTKPERFQTPAEAEDARKNG